MEPFTDEDLAKYKYHLKNVWAFKSDRKKMEALIARLEAAETIPLNCLPQCFTDDTNDECVCGREGKIEAWRKSCGKGKA